jgi:hypothetical protein
MVFQPGQAANPSGHNGRKVFIDALQTVISRPWDASREIDLSDLPAKPTIAHAMAYKLVRGALRDDWKPGESLAYLQEICDRAYGKAAQTVAVTQTNINLNYFKLSAETDSAMDSIDNILEHDPVKGVAAIERIE